MSNKSGKKPELIYELIVDVVQPGAIVPCDIRLDRANYEKVRQQIRSGKDILGFESLANPGEVKRVNLTCANVLGATTRKRERITKSGIHLPDKYKEDIVLPN